MLSLTAGHSLTIDSFGGEVPLFYLSGEHKRAHGGGREGGCLPC